MELAVTKPLSGIDVVAFEAIGPVPLACRFLDDLGADVLVIGRPPSARGGLPPTLASTAGQASMWADLKRPEGLMAVKALLSKADVLLEGHRPGVMERLGLGPDTVRELNPGIVYTRVTGWGQDGPNAHTAGHDINYIATTGALAAIGSHDRPHPPLNLLADYAGGTMFALTGLLAALVARSSTGEGSTIDVAMVDGVNALMGPIHDLALAGFWGGDRDANLLDGGAPFYTTYETSDGEHMAVGAIEPQFYSEFLTGLGIDEASLPNRFDPLTWSALRTQFAAVFATRSQAEWSERFEGTDACVSPVLAMDELMEYPHNRDREVLIPRGSKARPAPAPRFDDDHEAAAHAEESSPTTSRQRLVESGIPDDEVDRLVEHGALGW